MTDDLAARRDPTDADLQAWLDANPELPGAMPATPLPQIEASFGPEIPGALGAAEPGTWFEPVGSPYGAHLLIVDDRIAGGAPSLDQVRAAVKRD